MRYEEIKRAIEAMDRAGVPRPLFAATSLEVFCEIAHELDYGAVRISEVKDGIVILEITPDGG